MPKETVYLTDIEQAILRLFVERKILDDAIIANTLSVLTKKLES